MKCDPLHRFVRLYPVQEENIGRVITFDGTEWSFKEEWLAALKERWAPEYPLTRDVASQCDLEEYDDIQNRDLEEAPPPAYEEVQDLVQRTRLGPSKTPVAMEY
jgi:hypothetical protein